MSGDPVDLIARALLYEGYVLWPYRRSALKNQQRWSFGGVHPPAHARAHPDDPDAMHTECLVEGPDTARIDGSVRFLHVVERRVRDAAGRFVDELAIDGELHLAWEEATEREIPLAVPGRTAIAIPAGSEEEDIGDGAVYVRSWRELSGTVDASVERLGPGLAKLTVHIANATGWSGGTRPAALAQTFVSTHTVLRVHDGAFVSLTDPPEELREQAERCENVRTWPVLVGHPGERHTLLSSPIIVGDHQQIAPESPGDLFDGGEIDQLLILNVLALTDSEQAEARASDPRAREILDRCAALEPEQLLALHGRTARSGV